MPIRIISARSSDLTAVSGQGRGAAEAVTGVVLRNGRAQRNISSAFSKPPIILTSCSTFYRPHLVAIGK